MNIENSSLLSLFSSGASLEVLQQTLQAESLVSPAFSEALLATMQQLDGLGEADNTDTQAVIAQDISDELTSQLKLINEAEAERVNTLQGFADFLGQRLPVIDQTVKNTLEDVALIETGLDNKSFDEIDLDNTLSELSNVINTLKSIDTEGVTLDKEERTKAAKVFSFNPPWAKPLREKAESLSTEWIKPEDLDTKLNTEIEKSLHNKEKTLETPELKENELNQNKDIAKFATDIANLTRAVLPTHKAEELPPMTKHFAHPEWNKEVGERIIWMHKQVIPSAELKLNPQHLGPVTVKVDVTQDQQVTVSFTAQHAAVKEALEAAIPKLREMLNGQQLNLVDVNITQDDSRQRQAQNFNQMGHGSGERAQYKPSDQEQSETEEKGLNIADEIEAGRAIASQGVLSLFV